MASNPISMSATVNECTTVSIPKIHDVRGNLSVLERDTVPFEIKRVYYLYDIPSGAKRGGHAHIDQSELLIALSGSFEILVRDGLNEKTILLNKPNVGLLIPKGIWRELQDFSAGSVCLVLNSDIFREEDYIRDFSDFILFRATDNLD